MMKKHNVLSLVLAFCLCFMVAMPAWAANDNVKDNFVQVKGQIIFDDISESGILAIPYGADSILVSPQTLAFYNSTDEQTQNVMRNYISEGKTLKAIGWTKVYCEEDEDGNITPITVGEAIKNIDSGISPASTVVGNPNNGKPNFTLYTMVGYDNYEPSLLFAYSIGKWSTGVAISDEFRPEKNYDDFMSIEWPTGYHINNEGGINGGSKYDSIYLHDISENTLIYGFKEGYGEIQVASLGYNKSASGKNKWTSHYIHTWRKSAATIAVGVPSGVTITGVDNNTSWQVASGVDF